ncbi:hypothetical protein [Pseudaminobacter soli (ex Li et al. 2025)]|uniref:hypothetical protein n=1 Tax=Pseudaminobacter soli (ex Li et al. 2025) TaxID=1295366 RepID=UPI0011B29C20|nr:hypothetical protein [Mesorhizobium soli]
MAPVGIVAGPPVLDSANVVVLPELWGFHAMVPVTETLEWLTDVLGSRTGEQRIALRSAPRQTFSFSVRLSDAEYARARGFARRRAHTIVGVPVWAEAINLAVGVAASDSSIAMDTTSGDWRVDGGVVIWESPDKFVVTRIVLVAAGSLGLLAPVGVDLRKPKIIPLRSALVPEGFSVDRQATYSDVGVKFLVTDNIDLAASYVSTYPKYQGLDVVTEAPVLVADVSDSIVRSMDLIDNGTGPVVVETLRNYVDFGQTVSFMESRPSGVWKRRKWLHSLRGKQKPFWLPTFNRDLSLAASATSGATTIQVKANGPVANLINRHVMFHLTDGTRLFRQIASATVIDPDTTEIIISSALGRAVAPKDIAMICFVSKVRLNADAVTISHQFTADSVVNIPVMEVPA